MKMWKQMCLFSFLLLACFQLEIFARIVGKNPGQTKGRWLEYQDDANLVDYTHMYLSQIETSIEHKKAKVVSEESSIDEQLLADHIRKRLRESAEASGYFTTVASEPPAEDAQGKWLKVTANFLVSAGSRVTRYFVGFGAGKSKSILEISFQDHETGAEIAKYHGYGTGSGMGFKLGGGGAAKMAKDDIDENTEKCLELWGRVTGGGVPSN